MKILIRNRQRHLPLKKENILKTAENILTFMKQHNAELSIMFVSDRKMKELNTLYRGKKKTTDVLSFEAGIPVINDETENILGDIVISTQKAEAQAEEYGTGFYNEIERLLIHGTLHLLGYEHVDAPVKARAMRKKEKDVANALKKMD